MVTDQVRIAAYREALRRTVRPGSVVVDIGTGTGVFALLASRYGARRVFAIESDDVIALARENAAMNADGDAIEFIQARSDRVELPERADIVVSDLRGVLPWLEYHIPTIVDARERFLAPEGRLIPQRDVLSAALVETPELLLGRTVSTMDGDEIDLTPVARHVASTTRKVRVDPGQLLSEPVRWLSLEYTTVSSSDVDAELSFQVKRDGTACGFCLWFDAELVDDLGFSNAPGEQEAIYGQLFFPFEAPVEVSAGDPVTVGLSARFVDDGYVWRWTTEIADHRGEVRADYDQSSLAATLLSPERLRRRQTGYRPTLSVEGQVDRAILSLMDGEATLSEIAERIADRFPERFEDSKEALRRVAQLSDTHGR